MSSSNAPNSTQDVHEHLVAYLDGELDAETSRRVDDLLSTDPQVRKDVAELDASWNLLEKLPRSELGEDFTKTTLELVAQQAEAEVAEQDAVRPRRRMIGGAILLVGMFLAGLFGFLATDKLSPSQNDVLKANLPVIQQLDQLEQIGDFQFLQELRKQNLFQEDVPGEDGNEGNEEDNGNEGDNGDQDENQQSQDASSESGNN